MAAKEAKKLLLLLKLLLFSSVVVTGLEQEVELLLSFKSSIKEDPLNSLSNWNTGNSSCHWHGIGCDNNSSRVNRIDLSGTNISGKIPTSSIFRLPFIETINLANNHLSGEIPGNFSCCSSLRYLNLSNNNFTGPVLVTAGGSYSLSRLQTLDLSSNMLSGKIPAGVGFMSGLKVLDLGGNDFVGGIPKSLTNLTGLEVLTLSSNQLSGDIPGEIGLMKSLKWIYFGYNNLSGEIPNEIGDLTRLNHLDLVYNNLAGDIPESLGKLEGLEYLFLYQNKLSGPIPRSVLGLRKLVSLDLSDNSLSGEIPELVIQLRNLEILQLFSNNFTGKIPSGLASLPRLQVLQLWSNNFNGEIPKNLGEHNNLTVLDLSSNQLSGQIPDNLCNSGRLFKLILFSNLLEGGIPKGLSLCSSLQRVRLQDNQLSGELPPGFTKLQVVHFLDISNNNLSGEIGDRKWDMPELEMMDLARNGFSGVLPESFGSEKLENLELSENQFSGSIPSGFGNLSELMQLKINSNKLSGEIPETLSLCKKLVSLKIAHNRLVGEIPRSLCELPILSELDLSENQLSGEIPHNLGKVESLVLVNISQNHFHGDLPATGAFLAINASAVTGNNELCGGDLTTSGLPPCKRSHKNQTTRWFTLICLLVILVLIVLSCFVMVLVRRYRRNFESERIRKVEEEGGTCWELQFFQSNVSKAITINDVVSSTKGHEEGGEQNRQGISAKTGMRFVVKEIRDVNATISCSFWTEMAGVVGRVRHRNIIKLIGTCWSKKIGFLMYEFVEGKTLCEALGGLTSWDRRRRVACGVARALRFLHSYCSPGIVVGDMSPEKVIVDGVGEPRLRLEFGAAGIGCTDFKCLASSAYVAPETKEEAKDITDEKGDIYGFGLILIELLTGKAPADDAGFDVHQNIVEWAHDCYSDCHLDKWIDPTVRAYASNDQDEMVETMNLALQCTASDPTARPCASDVFKTLDSIMNSRCCHCVPRGLTFSSLV